ncbi:N-acetylmuramic acid 6-phosphate etherase [Risungbinella massiliensis]|uniref:N-acetylmuramic acid 6-phosphate etherase n=1 Tax=Risungbinella massiliensis TaxID=1329796 RepID=UPI0005CC6127|nr:N-acetylmuramic acid 6-phosphate etherase [Risungbinella massiliensis]
MILQLNKLSTEQRNRETMDIDELSTLEIVQKINKADYEVPKAVERELGTIAKVIDQTVSCIQNNGRLIYMGAGTSGRLGVLDASECPPTYGTDPNLVVALMAGGPEAFIQAKEGAEDDPDLGKSDLVSIQLTPNDIVIGLAASGRTPYVIGGLEYANQLGAKTAAIVCTDDSELAHVAHDTIAVVPGAEVVTGSTRMKAGTAQKLVLNMISTGTMIRLGKVYQNLMVDVKPTNEKLVQRARNIVQEATGCSVEQAEAALEDHQYHAKPAILQILTGLKPDKVRELLKKSQGVLKKALHMV